MSTTAPLAALVTGAGRRIGRAIALSLAKAGRPVAVHYGASRGEAETLVREIVDGGGLAVALDADLAREDEVAGLLPRAIAALGPVDCLVNNAAAFDYDSVTDASRESWDRHMEVNLRAPLVLSRSLADALPGHAAGNIVNMIDQRVWNLTPHFLSYTVSKTGLWTLTRTLALALAPRIRVNAIGPGPTLASERQSPEQFARQCAGTPLGHGTSPGEIAAAVQFVLASPSLTGQMLALDGGQHLGWSHPPDAGGPDE